MRAHVGGSTGRDENMAGGAQAKGTTDYRGPRLREHRLEGMD